MRVFVLLLLVALTASCAGGDGDVTITGDDANRIVVVDAGSSAIVELPANPSTGYTWEITAFDREVVSPVGEAVFEDASSDLVGAPGLLSFTLEALKSGTTDVQFVYHRPWEEVEPIDEFMVTIEVR